MLFSCVLDSAPRFHAQLLRLVASLRATGSALPTLVVRHTAPVPSDLAARLRGVVAFEPVEPFGFGSAAYCNKLQGLERLAASATGSILLCDLDLLFLDPPSCLRPVGAVRARIVDKPNPPPELLQPLLARCGFPAEPLDAQPNFSPASRTHRLNCNGGLYQVSGDQLRNLAPRWRHWATVVLGHSDLLGRYSMHADQLGFVMAMRETGLPFEHLPAHANVPVHFPAASYVDVPARISSLHYHDRVDASGRIRSVGHPVIDAHVARANACLAAAGLIEAEQLHLSPPATETLEP